MSNQCKFKVGDKVKRKDGTLFSNGSSVLQVGEVSYDTDYDKWVVIFKETGTYIIESDLMKVEYMGDVLWEREEETPEQRRIKELEEGIAKMQEELNKLL